MVLEKLGSSLKETLSKIAKSVFVDERLIDELVKDIQRALLHSDVNVKLVFELSKTIKERALKEKSNSAISQKENLVKIVYEELIKFLGGEGHKFEIKKKPFKIMLVGLFGNGKTTSAAKIGKYFSNRGNKVAVMQTDTWRPAAYHQLETLAKENQITFFGDKEIKSPLEIYKKFESKLEKYDIVIIDTAGRDALSGDLIKEIEELSEKIKPEEVLLVIAADVGQTAQKQAEQFHKSCGITGVVITKLDGTAKGGGALAASSATNAPIKFIGVGEKVDDIEEFNPKGFVGRILGMGDLEALLEKTKLAINEDKAEDLGKKFLKGDFNFLDLYEQLQTMSKMGPLNKIIDLIPGFGNMNIPKEMLNVQDDKLKKWKHIMQSMTKRELEDPELIDRNRIERIGQGAGVDIKDVRELLKQYRQSKKVMKMMKGQDPEKLMKKFAGKIKV
ncbi:signal recognition particle protein Srp54 [Candidatus Woesearchaeota archaeon]|nr:signal recognition particle protein Srp54 [Candidatus Woesearchaeota archaeon]